jgi:hypothetical protein
VKSVPFTVGGYNWVVRYYPNGSCRTRKLDNSIFVALVLDSAMAKDVKAKVRFSLLDKDREPMNSHSKTNEEYIFPMRGSNWGFKDSGPALTHGHLGRPPRGQVKRGARSGGAPGSHLLVK